MTELQRRAQQPDASFGDELSRVGPRVIDWATLATCCSRVTAPRLTFEGFANLNARLPEGIRASASDTQADFMRRLCDITVPLRAGLLVQAAPGVTPSISFGAGAGGRSLSCDGEVTVNPTTMRMKHCTVNVASPDTYRLDLALRGQPNQVAVFGFWSLGRAPLWHMPIPAAAELQPTAGGFRDLRRRWADRLDASRQQHDRLVRGLGTTRRPFVKVGVGFQAQWERMMMPLVLGGITAEVTQRTTIAFHADVLHRTCTTLTSRVTDSVTAVMRLRCNLITKAETTLDAGAEYRWTPAPLPWEATGLPPDAHPSPAEVAFRASVVSARVSVGFTSDNTLLGLSRLVGRAAVGGGSAAPTHDGPPSLFAKVCTRVSRDLRRAGDVAGPIRVTLGVSAQMDRLSPALWVDSHHTPRVIFSVSM